MNSWVKTACFATCVIGGSLFLHAQETPTTQPSSEMPTRHSRIRVPKPYSELPDLSQDQKDRIEQIHADMLEQLRKLQAQEKEQIDALLTDDQKKELQDMADKNTEQEKSRRLKSRIETDQQKLDQMNGATTNPSGQ